MPTKIIRRQINKKPGDSNQAHYSEKQKTEACVKYMVLGNLMEVHRQTGIPEITLRKWKTQPWWKDIENDVREQSTRELSGRIGRLLDKSLTAMEDRVSNGDFIYDPKSGSVKRIGVKASVANQITKDMIDRKLVLDRIAHSKKIDEKSINDRLQALQDAFLDFAKANTKVIKEVKDVSEAIDVVEESVEQVYEEEGSGSSASGGTEGS